MGKRPGLAGRRKEWAAQREDGAAAAPLTASGEAPSEEAPTGLMAAMLANARQVAAAKKSAGPTARAVAADQRRMFEDDVRNTLAEAFPKLPEGEEDDGNVYEFAPMDKAWRSVVHDIAEEMGLCSTGVGIEGADRHVQVSRTRIMTEEALEKEALRRDRVVRAVALRGGSVHAAALAADGTDASADAVAGDSERVKSMPRGKLGATQQLSLRAVSADAAARVVGEAATLNTKKRDLRTIEEIQADLKRRKT